MTSRQRTYQLALASAATTALLGPAFLLPATPAAAAPPGFAAALAPSTTIETIQGAAQRSPRTGTVVSDVSGIVTAVTRNGFWFQDPEPDGDPATSAGLFVFTNSRPVVTVRDAVAVDGLVSEFRAGGATSANLTTSQLTATRAGDVTRLSSGNALPPATVVGSGGRVPPSTVIEDDASGDVETSNVFDPAEDGIDFYESLEGMRITVPDAVAVGPRNDFGEIAVVGDGGAHAGVRSVRGGVVVRPGDFNPERVLLDDVLAGTPEVDTGDVFTSDPVGVLDYSFGNFKLLVTATPAVQRRGLVREVTDAQEANELAVATFNVENLAPADPASKYEALARTVVRNLAAPDVLAIEEIQDNDGAANTTVVDASLTWQRLIAAIRAAGGPTYDWRSISPQDDRDGGQPGGNIRVGFLFRTDKDLEFVDRPGGDATTPVRVLPIGRSGKARLSVSPGRIDPENPAFANSRKPLAGEFKFRGRTVFVVANHWNSKGGDTPLFGRYQPPQRSSEVQRRQQAEAVADFTRTLLGIEPDAALVVAGDLNDFEFSDAVQILVRAGLSDLPATLPLAERYTYVFDGNSQVLDHVLLSPALSRAGYDYDIVHVNADYADQVSDHDPQVVRLALKRH